MCIVYYDVGDGNEYCYLLPTGNEERGALGVESIPVAKLPSCQDMKTMAL